MKIIVGLGNPGEQYKNTRHNVGWMAIDRLWENLKSYSDWSVGNWSGRKNFEADMAEIGYVDQKFLFVKPTGFMNNSGRSVALVANFNKVDSKDIIVIYDDFDFGVGNVRVRLGGKSAGHNGVGSIIHHLGTDEFWRVRIGIDESHHESMARTDFVLANPSTEAQEKIEQSIDQAVNFVVHSLETGKLEECTLRS